LIPSKKECRLSPHCFTPRREIGKRLLVGRGIKPENRAALPHLFGNKILERRHLERLIGDLLSEMRGDHDQTVAITQNHIAGKHRRVAASDRNVDLDRLMQRRQALGGPLETSPCRDISFVERAYPL
jgi:hypothetical protein